jgi:hypothetical protein
MRPDGIDGEYRPWSASPPVAGVLKLNPITNSIGPVFGDALRALIEGGYLRIVQGRAEEAQYLVHLDLVETCT